MTDEPSAGRKRSFVPSDEDLWVRVRGVGKVYVVGNAHTFFGRMAGYAEAIEHGYTFSLDEVEDQSPRAGAWMAGFLAGNEPDLDEYLGFDEVWDLADDDPDVVRWHEALQRFGQTGYMPPLPKRAHKLIPLILGFRLVVYGTPQVNWCGSGTARAGQSRYRSHSSRTTTFWCPQLVTTGPITNGSIYRPHTRFVSTAAALSSTDLP